MKPVTSSKTSEIGPLTFLLTAYFLTGCLLIIFSFLPKGHVWAFNLLAYYPSLTKYVAAPIILLLVPVICVLLTRKLIVSEDTESTEHTHRFIWIVAAVTAVSVLLFYFFRTTTHFDGDGYMSLSNLYGGAEIIKSHNFGGMGLEVALYSLLGKGGQSTALFCYQIVSYTAGVLFLLVVALSAASLFESLTDRVLFFAGMAVGGYSMQFFGYIENYALFIVSVAAYLLCGILILKGRWPRWTILLINALAVFLHIFGLLLLPASAYILFRKTRLASWLVSRSRVLQGVLVLCCLLIGAEVFSYLSRTNYFFRFAFLPVVHNQFTASGYTMFSPNHLIDVLNLLTILCPGLLVLLVGKKIVGKSATSSRGVYTFMGLVTLCSLVGVFMLDPRLSMPRDWDVFAFAGVPLSMLLYVSVLGSTSKKIHMGRGVVVFAVSLGLVFLAASVAIRVQDKVAINRLKSFIKLDPVRNRNSRYFVSLYYKQKGNPMVSQAEFDAWKKSLVDDSISDVAAKLLASKRPEDGVALYRRILKINPWFSGSYSAISRYFISRGELDSAKQYLRIALGLQPGFPLYLNGLAWVEEHLGDDQAAEKYWLEAAAGDTTFADPLLYLLDLYKQQGRTQDYINTLIAVGKRPGVPNQQLFELAVHYCQISEWGKARSILDRAVANKLDSAHYKEITHWYPQLLDTSRVGKDNAVGH